MALKMLVGQSKQLAGHKNLGTRFQLKLGKNVKRKKKLIYANWLCGKKVTKSGVDKYVKAPP